MTSNHADDGVGLGSPIRWVFPKIVDKRDLLIYLLWKTVRMSNKEIGAFFGLTYSAVSRRIKALKDRLSAAPKLKEEYNKIKLLIPV